MSADPKNRQDLDTLLLHTLDGKSLMLRTKFIMAVHRPYHENYSRVSFDTGHSINRHVVNEDLDAFGFGFIRDDNLLLNPDYIGSIEPLSDDKEYSWRVNLHGPADKHFTTNATPEFYAEALRKTKGPKP